MSIYNIGSGSYFSQASFNPAGKTHLHAPKTSTAAPQASSSTDKDHDGDSVSISGNTIGDTDHDGDTGTNPSTASGLSPQQQMLQKTYSSQ
jgi:hypothetical protein